MIVDKNVWIRHLTGDPPDQAQLATEFLATERPLDLSDVVVAECVHVLESAYGVARWRVAEMMRSALGLASMPSYDGTSIRALELYETRGISFVDAYCLARSEIGSGPVATFDRQLFRRADSGSAYLLGE